MKVSIGKFPEYPERRKRSIKVHIDDWDVYSIDHTLALIIHPLIVKLREKEVGRPTGISDAEWLSVLDKIIWSMEQISSDKAFFSSDKEHLEKVQEGCELLGKWFQSLWY